MMTKIHSEIQNQSHEFSADRDEYGRIKAENYPGTLSEPELSQLLFRNGFNPVYPGNKTCAVCISHDIDRLFVPGWPIKTKLNQQFRALLSADFSRYKGNRNYFKRNIHPNHALKRLIDIENKFSIHSTWFFLSLTEQEKDFNYLPEEIKCDLQLLLELGHEIGLHGGHESWSDADQMKKEKERLEGCIQYSIRSYRNHYLKFNLETTVPALAANGFDSDSTMGYAEKPGFRSGFAHPFVPLNHPPTSSLLEIPLNVMDTTLFSYLKQSPEEAIQTTKSIVEKCKAVNGVFTFLIHNNDMIGEKEKFYTAILEFLSEQDVWFATHHELTEYWRKSGYDKQMNNTLKKLEIDRK